MSTLVINEIAAGAAQITKKSTAKKADSQTTITPFQKVLASEENKIYATANTNSASQTSKTSKTSSNRSSGSAQTTLKDIFERASEKYDISYDFLVSVAKAESDFNTKCVSSAGAKGVMQIMPDECKEFGVDDPFDAEQNIMAAAKLLKAHLKKFDGDYTLAAAAYNAGSGTVKKYGGVPPYTETQNYVKKINKYMKEGVTVPDKTVSVSATDSSEGSGGSTGTSTKTTSNTVFDTGEAATASDLEKVTVAVGTGEDTVTMTYGAYLKYLELGTTGVG